MARFYVTLFLFLALAANVAAETTETIEIEFEMLGAAGTVHQIHIVSEPDTGITICSTGREGLEGRVELFAHSVDAPLLTYHSSEVGQVAIVPYQLGGGTGVSYSRYFVFCCTEHGCQVLHEGLAKQHSVSITTPRLNFILVSEFRALPKGFSQLVHLELPAQTDREEHSTGRLDSFKPVELRFEIERGTDGLQTICAIDGNSAHVLLDIVEHGFPDPQDWAVGVLEEQWPDLVEPLAEYLVSPPSEQAEQIHALRAALNEICTLEASPETNSFTLPGQEAGMLD